MIREGISPALPSSPAAFSQSKHHVVCFGRVPILGRNSKIESMVLIRKYGIEY